MNQRALALAILYAGLIHCAEQREEYVQSGNAIQLPSHSSQSTAMHKRDVIDVEIIKKCEELIAFNDIKRLADLLSQLNDNQKAMLVAKYDLIELKGTVQKGNIFHSAASSGHMELLKWLLIAYPSMLGSTNKSGSNVLHIAARKGHKEIVEFLLTTYPHLQATRSQSGGNVLHHSAVSGNKELIEWLLKLHPNLLNTTTNGNRNVLHIVCFEGAFEAATFLATLNPQLLIELDGSLNYPLFYLANKSKKQLDEFLYFFQINKSTVFKNIPLGFDHIFSPIINEHEMSLEDKVRLHEALLLCMQYYLRTPWGVFHVGMMATLRNSIIEVLQTIGTARSIEYGPMLNCLTDQLFALCKIEIQKLINDNQWSTLKEMGRSLRAKGIPLLKTIYSKEQISQIMFTRVLDTIKSGDNQTLYN